MAKCSNCGLAYDKKMMFFWKIVTFILAVASGILCVIVFSQSDPKSTEQHTAVWNTFSEIEKMYFDEDLDTYRVSPQILFSHNSDLI